MTSLDVVPDTRLEYRNVKRVLNSAFANIGIVRQPNGPVGGTRGRCEDAIVMYSPVVQFLVNVLLDQRKQAAPSQFPILEGQAELAFGRQRFRQ